MFLLRLTCSVFPSAFYPINTLCLPCYLVHLPLSPLCLSLSHVSASFFLYLLPSVSVSSSCRAKPAPRRSRQSVPRRGEWALWRWDALSLQPAKQRQHCPPETRAPCSDARSTRTRTRWRSGPSWPGWGGHQPPMPHVSAPVYCSRSHWPSRRLVWGPTSASQWAFIHSVHTT